MSFQIHALPAEQFKGIFDLSDEELKTQNAWRETVETKPGTPCRISLEDAEVGEEVILLNYFHQSDENPYKACHAIFVRKDVKQAHPKIDEIPSLFRHRVMSVRAFNPIHKMIDADVVEGTELEKSIETMFENPQVSYIHLHNAKPGCYAAKVTRA